MSNLIDELKGEHGAIVNMLNKVRELGIGSKEGQDRLMSAKASLLAHLAKEDQKLYPVLSEGAKKDQHLKGLMETFAMDMDEISKSALEFFNKYAFGGSGVEFAKEFGRLFVVLGSRIQKEESMLYKEYDKLA